MKNISLNINPNAITSLTPHQYQAPPGVQPLLPKSIYSISFSAQFDTEEECLKFVDKLLNSVNEMKE